MKGGFELGDAVGVASEGKKPDAAQNGSKKCQEEQEAEETPTGRGRRGS